jgi:hypothetical protein
MKQKYTWKGLVIFGLIFCVLLAVFSIPFYECLDWGYQYQDIKAKSDLIQQDVDTSYDVLFLGDSQGWATYSPVQMYGEHGFTSYNACTSGQFPYDGYVMLRNFYRKKKTNLVVLDANMIYTSANISKVLLMNLFPIFHYHDVNINDCNQTYSDNLKGFNSSQIVQGYTGTLNYMNLGEQSEKIEQDGVAYLEKIYKLTKKNNSQLLIVSTVDPLNWNQKRHDKIQKWCEEHNLNYVDYNETSLNQQIGFDYSTDFRDGGDHLNLSGSKKVCTYLGSYLQTTYELEDHRKDEKYQAWNQLYNDASEYHGV